MGGIKAISLEELLAAREIRAAKQHALIRQYAVPLVSFMVNIPGPYKDTPLTARIFSEGLKALFEEIESRNISQVYREVCSYSTGAEAFIAVDYAATDLKTMVVAIEETHPLGRLFDFDVIGISMKHLSRDSIGIPTRKCLLCNEDAHACGRSRNHSLLELEQKIQAMADAYFRTRYSCIT